MEPLFGIDPDATQDLKVGGATFTLGTIEAGQWQRLEAKLSGAVRNARRRSIALCAKEGVEADQPSALFDGLTNLQERSFNDPDYKSDLFAVYLEALLLSARGHSNFLQPNGPPVPFQRSSGIVTGTTARWYGMVPRLALTAWPVIQAMHTLADLEKKDSPQPSSVTATDSTAEAANAPQIFNDSPVAGKSLTAT